VPFTTIVVGRFGHFAPAIWLSAGQTYLIAAVGLRLVSITPHLEQGDHLRHRQLSAILLMVSSLLAIAASFVNPRLALWALALNFAVPLMRKWSRRPASRGPNRPHSFCRATGFGGNRPGLMANWFLDTLARQNGFLQQEPVMDEGTPGGRQSSRTIKTRCCIVGGGPAGMMLGYLLGRAGVETLVLEKHADFFRDFRGDTVHPSTLQVMDELGLIDGFLKLPHQQLQKLEGNFGDASIRLADISRLNVKYPFIAFMPQWDFLDFLRESGKRFPSLKVMMNTDATDLIWSGETVAGVVADTSEGPVEIRADLTIGCDGRHSMVRQRAKLEVEEIGAPMDVLWFRAGRRPNENENLVARLEPGKMMVTFDRGDYWQCAYVIAKGQYDAVKARGLDAFRADVVSMAPVLKTGMPDVKTWDDVKLLTVAINRLKRWTRPGLLCIGDAAHAMSPVGGVGVNLAVQDAVASANLLAAKLVSGAPSEDELDAVRRRREFPVRITQAMQVVVQNNIISAALKPGDQPLKPPLLARVINAVPWLQGITARFVALGVRPEHVQSPASASPSRAAKPIP
jgi:2-polyprenyl-6-methoxyphenol hydroxylase-like FAD-dependent oxidoreductase